MKKCIVAAALLLIAAAAAPAAYAVSAEPAISAKAAIVIHADTGNVLYEKNADEQMLIASTTKLMTALVVLENCQPDEKVEIKPEYTLVGGSSMYLKPGDSYTVEQLLYGMMLASGNDAALALAYHTAGSVEGFADMMNEEAARLGLSGSSFKNPHGLDEEGHYSCARDLAGIMREAIKDELFCQIISTRSYTCGEQTYINHNKLLWNCKGVIGGKTGYTMAAGRSLVSYCDRGDMKLICVTLSDPDDWNDHAVLYDWGYENYEYDNPLGTFARISVPVISGNKKRVTVAVSGDFRVFREKGAKAELETDMDRFVFAPVNAGNIAGRVKVIIDGETVSEAELCFCESVDVDKSAALTPWERFKRIWYMSMRYGYTLR